MNNSFKAGISRIQMVMPSSRRDRVGWLSSGVCPTKCFWLTLRSMNIQMIGVVVPRSHRVVKTRSLKSRVKIFKTSERTVCSKASWLPNQICTLALRVADKPEDCFRLLSDDVIINHKPTTIYNHLGGNLVFPADRFIRRV